MQALMGIFMSGVALVFYLVLALILWKFYEIASQIKSELIEIKGMMRDRMNPPTGF
jgi:hypothetical protein